MTLKCPPNALKVDCCEQPHLHIIFLLTRYIMNNTYQVPLGFLIALPFTLNPDFCFPFAIFLACLVMYYEKLSSSDSISVFPLSSQPSCASVIYPNVCLDKDPRSNECHLFPTLPFDCPIPVNISISIRDFAFALIWVSLTSSVFSVLFVLELQFVSQLWDLPLVVYEAFPHHQLSFNWNKNVVLDTHCFLLEL